MTEICGSRIAKHSVGPSANNIVWNKDSQGLDSDYLVPTLNTIPGVFLRINIRIFSRKNVSTNKWLDLARQLDKLGKFEQSPIIFQLAQQLEHTCSSPDTHSIEVWEFIMDLFLFISPDARHAPGIVAAADLTAANQVTVKHGQWNVFQRISLFSEIEKRQKNECVAADC